MTLPYSWLSLEATPVAVPNEPHGHGEKMYGPMGRVYSLEFFAKALIIIIIIIVVPPLNDNKRVYSIGIVCCLGFCL